MIQLTRLRQNTPFILNPDLIERVDTHVDTVVRLTSGAEYVVNETGAEIVRLTANFRAHVLALAGLLQAAMPDDDLPPTASSYQSPAVALAPAVPSDAPAIDVADTEEIPS
jgi:uncharacterized protein YlzI (FlbEa/FlbD family)